MASAPVIIGDCTEPVRVGFVIDLPPAIFRLTALSSPLVMDGICLGRYLVVSKGVFGGKCLNLSPQLGQPFAPCCLCTGKALTCPLAMHFPCSEPAAVPTAMHSFLNLCTSSPHSHSQSNDLLKVLQGLAENQGIQDQILCVLQNTHHCSQLLNYWMWVAVTSTENQQSLVKVGVEGGDIKISWSCDISITIMRFKWRLFGLKVQIPSQADLPFLLRAFKSYQIIWVP